MEVHKFNEDSKLNASFVPPPHSKNKGNKEENVEIMLQSTSPIYNLIFTYVYSNFWSDIDLWSLSRGL